MPELTFFCLFLYHSSTAPKVFKVPHFNFSVFAKILNSKISIFQIADLFYFCRHYLISFPSRFIKAHSHICSTIFHRFKCDFSKKVNC